jgi:hypothetical protein
MAHCPTPRPEDFNLKAVAWPPKGPASCSPDVVEKVAKAIHAAFGPFGDYSYPWGDPLSSPEMFRTLARAAIEAMDLESMMRRVDAMQERMKRLEFEVAQRGMALAPFAEACDNCIDDEPDDHSTWEHAVGMEVTFRDFREARAALSDGIEEK